jgi:hypothetical protein
VLHPAWKLSLFFHPNANRRTTSHWRGNQNWIRFRTANRFSFFSLSDSNEKKKIDLFIRACEKEREPVHSLIRFQLWRPPVPLCFEDRNLFTYKQREKEKAISHSRFSFDDECTLVQSEPRKVGVRNKTRCLSLLNIFQVVDRQIRSEHILFEKMCARSWVIQHCSLVLLNKISSTSC